MPIDILVDRCVRRGVNCLAVTDHNTIQGALAVQQIAPFKVIIGEEIKTNQGENHRPFLKGRDPPRAQPPGDHCSH